MTEDMAAQNPVPQEAKKEMEHCRFCKRPTHCRKCNESQDPRRPKLADGEKVDIDSDVPDLNHQLPPYPSPLPPKNPSFYHCMPPDKPIYQDYSVFLAGSIEMGNAIQWQRQMAVHLQDLPISVYNPRRGEWDPAATQEAKNAAFRHQVEWELEALHKAKVVCFFFDYDTMSPVTMCELGLWAHSGKVVVCCNKKFWKGGNIHIVCERYGIPLVEQFSDLELLIRAMLRQKGLKTAGLPDEEVLKAAGWRAEGLKIKDIGTA